MFTIGIDVGGTSIRTAAIDSVGRILSSRRAPTPRTVDDFHEWIVRAIQLAREDIPNESVVAVGLALPGVLDAERGVVQRCVNLPFLEGRLLRDELSKNTGLAVTLMTDADAATWGEYSSITPRPKAFVHLRLGTGVACGIVADNRLQPTDPNRTTHWKVLVVDDRPEAVACPCGLRGCLETIASGPALEAHAARMGFANGLDGLQQAWERHELAAHTVVDTAANATASAIVNLESHLKTPLPLGGEGGVRGKSGGNSEVTLSPHPSPLKGEGAIDYAVCLGGGVITALPCLLEKTAKHLRSFDDEFARSVVVHPPRLSDDAGVIGAAMLARV